MHKLLKGSFLLTSTKVLDLIVDLLNIAIISRLFTLTEYGLYSQIIIIVSFFASFINLGLPSSINFFLAREESFEKKKKYLSNILILVNLIGILSFITLFYFKGYISNYFSVPMLSDYAFVYSILPWMRLGTLLRDNVFIVMQKVSNAILNRVVMSLVRLLLPITMLFFNLTFNNYVLLLLIVEVLLFIYVQTSVLILFKGLSLKFIKIKLVKEIISYSLPLGLALSVGTINIQFDKLLIGKYFNTDTFAIYVNMSREIPVAALSASIVTIIMPTIVVKIKGEKFVEVVDLWNQTIKISFFLISPIIAILLCMSSETITLLYSEKYLKGINVFRIYVLVLYFRVIYFGMILNAAGKTKKILHASLFSVVLNIVLSMIFIQTVGLTGPAWATLISIFVISVYQIRETSVIVHKRIRDLFPINNILLIFLKDMCMILITYLIKVKFLYPFGVSAIPSLFLIIGIWVVVTIIFYFKVMKNK